MHSSNISTLGWQQALNAGLRNELKPLPALWGRYQDDLLGYIENGLHARLWDRQREIIESVRRHRKTLVLSANGIGKTFIAAAIAQARVDVAPGICYTSAPTQASLVDKLWKEIRIQRPQGHGGRLYETPLLRYSPDHFLSGITSAHAEGFQGQHHTRLLVEFDEAPGCALWAWQTAERMCVSPENRILAIGNPFESTGPFWDAAQEGSGWNVIQVSALEHPNIIAALAGLPEPFPGAVSLVSVEEGVREHCEPTSSPDADSFEWPPESGSWYTPDTEFEGRVLGRFPTGVLNTLIPPRWIDQACSPEAQRPLRGEVVIGVDPARFGDDKTAIHVVKGVSSLYHDEFSQMDTMKVAFEVQKVFETCHAVRINVDVVGIGAGVYDYLKFKGLPVCEVNASESPMEKFQRPLDEVHYDNVRQELWGLGHDIFHDQLVDLTRLDKRTKALLRAQLGSPTYTINRRGHRAVEEKDRTKKRTGRSPDGADAFLMARYPTVLHKDVVRHEARALRRA